MEKNILVEIKNSKDVLYRRDPLSGEPMSWKTDLRKFPKL